MLHTQKKQESFNNVLIKPQQQNNFKRTRLYIPI